MNRRFVTISTYAKLCGINRESVYKRLKSGKLQISESCEHPLIDVEEYPPNRLKQLSFQPTVKNKCPF